VGLRPLATSPYALDALDALALLGALGGGSHIALDLLGKPETGRGAQHLG